MGEVFIPFDCMGIVIEYCNDSKTLHEFYLCSKYVQNYLEKINPKCCRNVKFNLNNIHYLKSPKLYVLQVSLNEITATSRNAYSSKIIEIARKKKYAVMRVKDRRKIDLVKRFPNLERVFVAMNFVQLDPFPLNLKALSFIKVSSWKGISVNDTGLFRVNKNHKNRFRCVEELVIRNCDLTRNVIKKLSSFGRLKKLTVFNHKHRRLGYDFVEKWEQLFLTISETLEYVQLKNLNLTGSGLMKCSLLRSLKLEELTWTKEKSIFKEFRSLEELSLTTIRGSVLEHNECIMDIARISADLRKLEIKGINQNKIPWNLMQLTNIETFRADRFSKFKCLRHMSQLKRVLGSMELVMFSKERKFFILFWTI